MVQNGKLELTFISTLVNNIKKDKMKTTKYKYIKATFLFLLALSITSCERELSDKAEFATYGTTGDIFIDAPVGLTDQFFVSFDPAGGANTEGFGTDESVTYQGASAIRIDVPAGDDFNGGFIGGIFVDRGAGRNLTGYDALTFWAKGSTTATIGLVGFGTDFIEDKYAVGLENIKLSTDWRKYTIPIPDASKLIQEKGMFIFSAGGIGAFPEMGYTFWMDELKFEKLGTLGQPQPAMANKEDKVETKFLGDQFSMADYGLTQTFNLASGINQTVTAAPSYFSFTSSDIEVARVSDAGIVSLVGSGSAKITASIAGVAVAGSLTINVAGAFPVAPTPSLAASNVISIFSDAYTDEAVNYYNGFWEPYQTTLGGETTIDGQSVLNYTNFNFVGTQLTTPIDISEMTHLSIDILMPEVLPTDIDMLVQLKSENTDPNTFQQQRIGGQTYAWDPRTGDVNDTESNATFETGGVWKTIKIPIRPTSETGLDKTTVNLIIIENIKNSNVTEFHIDNLYFYKE